MALIFESILKPTVSLLPDLLSAPRGVLAVCFAAALTALLVVLQQFTTRLSDKKRLAPRPQRLKLPLGGIAVEHAAR